MITRKHDTRQSRQLDHWYMRRRDQILRDRRDDGSLYDSQVVAWHDLQDQFSDALSAYLKRAYKND